jgi:hypothetical protein
MLMLYSSYGSLYIKHKNICFTNSDIADSVMSDVDDLSRTISEDLYFN